MPTQARARGVCPWPVPSPSEGLSGLPQDGGHWEPASKGASAWGSSGEGLLDPPVSDACPHTHRPSSATTPGPNCHPRTEGLQASPSAKLSQSTSPLALRPAARTEPQAPLSMGTTSAASTSSQAGVKSSVVSSGASRAGDGSRQKLETPLGKGRYSPYVDE